MTLLPQVLDQLYEVARQRARRRRWWLPVRSRSRLTARAHRVAGDALIGALALISVGVGLFALALHHSAPTAQSSSSPLPGPRSYVNAAIAEVADRDSGCNDTLVEGGTSQGRPSALLAVLGVLRRPATTADTPKEANPPPQLRSAKRKGHLPARRNSTFLVLLERQGTVYVRFVRRARIFDGSAFYIVPMVNGVHRPAPAACLAEQRATLARILAGASGPVRTKAMQAAVATFATERQIVHTKEVVMLIQTDPVFGGAGSTCCSDAAAILAGHGDALTEGGGSGQDPRAGTFSAVVPDRVASVTLDYRAARFATPPGEPPPTGTSTAPYPPMSVTVKPVANVLAIHVERDAMNASPHQMVWRSASGTIIKTITEP